MTAITKIFVRVLFFFFFLSISTNAQPLQKIKLQLQWKHQFEFAGFYAAQEKGFYADVGLDVTFVEYDNKMNITQEVLNDNAQYGITYASIIAEYLDGKPVVLVANIFKQSPLVIVAQEYIRTPAQLKGKKVMGVSNSIDNIILLTMLDKFGVSYSDIQNVPSSFSIDDFINKRVDAMSIFTTNEIFKLNEQGIKYNIFDPTVYGAKYYDINLFTTQKEANLNPTRVRHFRDASIKGWKYALQHQDEIIELIIQKYNTQNKGRKALEFEAKQIEQLMLSNLYKIGSIDKDRVQSISDMFLQSNLIKDVKKRDLSGFIFKEVIDHVHLTQKEKDFIRKHPKIVLGSGDSWAPYVIQNSDGTISGYDNDILAQINNITGANFVQKLGDWSKIQKMVEDKKIDGLSTLTKTKIREEFLEFSDIYISLEKMVMVKQRNPLNIKSAKDLEGKTIVIHRGNVADKKASKEFIKSIIIYADTPKEMLEEVIYGRADATFGNGATEYMLSKVGLPYMQNAFSLDNSLDLRFAIRKDLSEAISILNKGLATISQHKRVILKQKWFSLNNQEKILNKINLTLEEKKYSEEKKVIKMCVDPTWMPLEEIIDGKHNGFVSDYIKILNQKINIPIELLETKNWKESLEKFKQKKCDIISSAEKTPLREKYMDFTTPYITIPIVIATKMGVGFIDNIEQVLDKKIGIVRGYSLDERLREKFPNIKIIEVDSIRDGLAKVENGTVFGYIDNSMVINSEIQNNYIGTLAISGRLKENLSLSIGIRSDENILRDIFEKLVLSIDIGVKQKILNKWITISSQEKIDYSLIWKISFIFIFIIIFFVYRQYEIKKVNIRLKDEVDRAIIKSKEQDKFIFQQSKLVAMGEMIENIAHQWRQPLSQINSAVLLVDDELYNIGIENKIILDKLEEIEKTTKYMSKTIDDFRSFYKENKIKESFFIGESINIAISLVKSSLKYNNIEIVTEINKSIQVTGFKNEFEQAILVILNNAKDILISRGILNPKIIVKLNITDISYLLSIQDNGGGIEQENITKIFDPYFTTKHQSLGTGLGLYLSKIIIEESMNSKLYVENIDDGACFYIEFNKGNQNEK